LNIEYILFYGSDIINSPGMQSEKKFNQHAGVSVYDHSCFTASMCCTLCRIFHIRADYRCMVRGALLHDYFLYDWHIPDRSHRLHGFTHPKAALDNAKKDFYLTDIEEDLILHHMFPLTLIPPKTTEGMVLCIADKLCTVYEIFTESIKRMKGRVCRYVAR